MISRQEKNKEIRNNLKKEKNIKRSKNIMKIFILFFLVILFIFAYMRLIGTNFIVTHEYVIQDETIPSNYHGVKIVHFSDLLYGSTIFENDLKALNEEIKRINPDLIFFTGDLITGDYQASKEELDSLRDFFNKMNATIGKYAVKGNSDATSFDLIMNDTDFTILSNTYEKVYYKENSPILLVGLNVNNQELIQIQETNLYTITLIHNYDYFAKYGINSQLVLAGHNLRGEIYIPKFKGLLGDNQYNDNYYELSNNKVYISSGLGSPHKLRLFNHPSINVYRLYTH